MRKSILLSLALVLVLSSTLSFAPAPTVEAAQPQAFNSYIVLVPASATNNEHHGESDRYRTIYENYAGWTFRSSWREIDKGHPLNGTPNAFMSITTNFVETDTGAFSGPYHSTLVINTLSRDGTITLNLTGKIEGQKGYKKVKVGVTSEGLPIIRDVYMIVQATITGKFNSTGASGSLAGKHVNGDLNYLIDLTKADFTVLPPTGIISIGTLTGTYN